MAAPPGWHPDPHDPSRLRYWDGQQWTDHYAQVEAPPTPATPVAPATPTEPAAPKPGPTAQPQGEGWSNKKAIVVAGSLVGAILVVGLVGTAIDNATSDDDTSAASSSTTDPTAPTTPTPTTTPTTDPPPEPDPDARYSSSCDYVLGNFTSNTPRGYRFVAGANVRNTGNIGIVAEFQAKWFRLGTSAIVKTKEFRLDTGTSKRINVTVPTSQDNIDLHQSLGFNDKTCDVKVTLIDTYGKATDG